MKTSKEKSELTLLIEKEFPDRKDWKGNRIKFQKNVIYDAGRLLKTKGYEATVEYLKANQAPSGFGPPAKCNILQVSRPFEDWPIYQASKAIQEFVYKLPAEKGKPKIGKPETTEADRNSWFSRSQVNNYGFTTAQGLNLIFQHAYNRYDGAIKRIENNNKKLEKKILDNNNRGHFDKAEELTKKIKSPTKEDGTLLEPPGINQNIYFYQGVSPKCIDINNKNHQKVLSKLINEKYKNYKLLPTEIIPTIGKRLEDITLRKNSIPDWQIKGIDQQGNVKYNKLGEIQKLNPQRKRIRKYVDKDSGALLILLAIGEDWAIVDARGLLRSCSYRKKQLNIVRRDLTLQKLLDLFTGDPVVDIKRNIVSFTYRDKFIENNESVNYKLAPGLLKSEAPCLLASIDLGQNEFLAAKVSRITKLGEELEKVHLADITLPDKLIAKYKKYREIYDKNEEDFKKETIRLLSESQQREIETCQNNITTQTKKALCDKYNILESELPWEKMNSWSCYISDLLITKKVDDKEIYFETKPKKGSPKKLKKYDQKYSYELRNKWSEETRKEYNDLLWNNKRKSEKYQRLSRYKEELARETINWLKREISRLDGYRGFKTIFNIESLDCANNKFSGSGKRESGWDNFFVPKKENRWFIPAFKKEFSNLPHDKGDFVIESWPSYTSLTCPKCGFCDKENRNGIEFKCKSCDFIGHADKDVATYNLEKVALTGKALPGYERPSDDKKAAPARKAKLPKGKGNFKASLKIATTELVGPELLATTEITV